MVILAALNAGAVLLTLLPGASDFRRRMKVRMRFCTSSPFRPGMSTVPLNISMVPAFTSFSLMLRHRLCVREMTCHPPCERFWNGCIPSSHSRVSRLTVCQNVREDPYIGHVQAMADDNGNCMSLIPAI